MSRPLSISLRLTLWFGGIFFLGWLLFGVAMWLNLRSTLVSERYGTLVRRENRLATLLQTDQRRSAIDRRQDFAGFARATGHGLCQVLHADGSLAYSSPAEVARVFPWPKLRKLASEQFEQVSWAGQSYWVLSRPFSLGDERLYLVAAAPQSDDHLVLNRFLIGLLASVPILLLISSAGGYFLSRRALLPVDRIAASARSISITNLSARVPVPRTGDELQRLSETCNAMLERLEEAVNRIRQFTADASHDLRGPVSFIRTVAEVALRNAKIDADSQSSFAEIVNETANASELLENLLTLARADADRAGTALAPLDLAAVVEETCDLARPLAAERSHTLTIAMETQRTVRILGDFASLRRLLWILLDNALKYTPSPGRIDVRLSSSGRQATVTVHDNGLGIRGEDLPRIFDRFYRADPSRSQVEGSGLGLAIAKWIAEMHRAEFTVASEENAGTTFGITFPLYSD